jgi:hypothetical protein
MAILLFLLLGMFVLIGRSFMDSHHPLFLTHNDIRKRRYRNIYSNRGIFVVRIGIVRGTRRRAIIGRRRIKACSGRTVRSRVFGVDFVPRDISVVMLDDIIAMRTRREEGLSGRRGIFVTYGRHSIYQLALEL